MQFSVRSFLAIVAFVAISVAALLLGKVAALLFFTTACLVLSATLINSLVSAGLLRSMSIGFLIPALVYGSAVCYFGKNELNAYGQLGFASTPSLPTSRLFQTAFKLMYTRKYIDMKTGKAIPDFDVSQPHYVATNGMPTEAVGAGPTVVCYEFPAPLQFMQIFHVIAAFLFGSLGAMYAKWITKK